MLVRMLELRKVVNISTPSGRVAWYLRKIWSGSQTRMAADTGLTQAAISKVVLGRRNPGRRFLLAVAGHPLVNGSWLLSGIGDPLLQPGMEGASGELMLPLAERLLPGPVEEHRDYLSGAFIPVFRQDFAASRYWYRIGDADQGLPDLVAGDLLLLESDSSVWTEDPRYARGRICAVCVRGPRSDAIRLGVVENNEPKLTIKLSGDASEREAIAKWSKPLRQIQLDPVVAPDSKPGQAREPLEKADKIAPHQIVAVAILQLRVFKSDTK